MLQSSNPFNTAKKAQVHKTMKTFRLLDTIRRVPAGLMIVPLVLGCILYTFVPQILEIGTPFSAAFTSKGTMTLIGMILFFSGSQFKPSQVKITLKRGGTLALCKLLLGVGAGAAFFLLFGKEGVFGISSMAFVIAMTSLLPAFYIGLMDAYGDDIDRAAYGLLNLLSIPAVPICILSFENSGGLNYMALLASVVPFLLGMLLGNLDPAIRRLFAPAGTICLPFLGFTLGTSINLMSCIYAFAEGLALTAVYLVVNNLPLLFVEKKLLHRRGHASSGFCGIAAMSLAVPAMLGELDPGFLPYVETAAAQIASAVVFSNILNPLLTRLVVVRYNKKHPEAALAERTGAEA
jgi:2-keto-3-deoxygluconate permease